MSAFRQLGIVPVLGVCALWSCAAPHGRPAADSPVPAPTEVLAFDVLYAQNCAGCHGRRGRGGAAISLGDPVYLAHC